MKTQSILMGILFICSNLLAQTNSFEVKLWPNGPKESNEITVAETISDQGFISNVTDPIITIYPADKVKNTGSAVLICPGGGYTFLAANHEGRDFAQWFAENGITGIVLKYRLPNHHHQIPLEDAQQAVRILRERSAEWGINPEKIGVIGFSAGGHLASTLLTHFDDLSRPDFGILVYPVVSFDPLITHGGSVSNLLGTEENLRDYYSNEKQVTEKTPPTLLLHSDDDTVVDPQNSILFYEALKSKKVQASLHIFPTGGHGWGFNLDYKYHEQVKTFVLDWVKLH